MSTLDDTKQRRGLLSRFLDGIEWLGNKLPDPVVLFLIGIIFIAALSYFLSQVSFAEHDPRKLPDQVPIQVKNLVTLQEFANLLTNMVKEYVNFAPLGVVLVALLGVGVAEQSGFINAVLKSLLDITPKWLMTPMVIFVAILSHTCADAGYVLVIPIAGLMYYVAGRHPLAGVAAGFAGVSGGFSANSVPSALDPLLAGLTQVGAATYDPNYAVNPLCNWYFTASSSILIVAVGWLITDCLIEPRLKGTPVDEDADIPQIEALDSKDRKAMWFGLASMVLGLWLLFLWAWPHDSALRDKLGSLTSSRNLESEVGMNAELTGEGLVVRQVQERGAAAKASLASGDIIQKVDGKPVDEFLKNNALEKAFKPDISYLLEFIRGDAVKHSIYVPASIPGAALMHAIVPLIFFLFIIPGIVFGYLSGRFKTHRDVVKGMSKSMESMAYYLVLVFFVALFIYAFNVSNIGVLVAVKGANFLQGKPLMAIIVGIVAITALVNLLIGSASAKWAMLAPIFVPMMMLLGISPEFTQAAYRVGDSCTNIITPLMPYFPLVVIYGQRYVKKMGIGTLTSLMLPYSMSFLVIWSIYLLIYWQLGIPLGVDGGYEYVKPE